MPAKAFVDTNIRLYSLIQNGDDNRHQSSEDMQHGQKIESGLTIINPFI